MKDSITLADLNDSLTFFEKMYDAVRIVDPLCKSVLDSENKNSTTGVTCYNYWQNSKICDNCISVRAYEENKSYMKLERINEKIFVVTAVPISDSKTHIVLELLKETTDTMFLGMGEYGSGVSVKYYVDRINNLIVKDSLTKLYNKRYIFERLPSDIVSAVVKKIPITVCFIDIDDFKNLNDSYGHEYGDRALSIIGKILKKNIRSDNDWAARYGGDEFVICFNNINEEKAKIIVSRIKKDIESEDLCVHEKNINVNISYGIKTMLKDPLTAEEIINFADKEMYKNKSTKKKDS